MSAVVLGIVVVGGIVLAGVLISRAADREQRHVDEARAAARSGRATIVEVASTNSAVTSPGVRREGYRFVLDLVRDGGSGGGAEPRRVSVVWYVPAVAVPQLQPGEVVPVVADGPALLTAMVYWPVPPAVKVADAVLVMAKSYVTPTVSVSVAVLLAGVESSGLLIVAVLTMVPLADGEMVATTV